MPTPTFTFCQSGGRRAVAAAVGLAVLLVTCHAAPPLRWDVQQANPKSADWYIYRGESVDLLPRLVDGTHPADITGTPATLRYREPALPEGQYRAIAATNIAAGTWLIPWAPVHDAGAPYYDYQLWIGDSPANNRITGRLVMRESIGVPPAGDPPPPIAGWATPADLQAVSNALAQALQELDIDIDYTETDPVALPALATHTNDASIHMSQVQAMALLTAFADTGTVSRATCAERLGDAGEGRYWLTVGGGGAKLWEEVPSSDRLRIARWSADYNGPRTSAGFATPVGWLSVVVSETHALARIPSDNGVFLKLADFHNEFDAQTAFMSPDPWAGDYPVTMTKQTPLASGYCIIDHALTTNSYALPTRAQMDAATNAIWHVLLDSTNAYVEVVGNVFSLYTLTNGVKNVLWQSDAISGGGGGVDQSVINDLYQQIADLYAAISLLAPKAWGNYAPDGSVNPDPAYMVFLNRPTLMYAAGYRWETYGTIAALASSGTVALETGGTGTWRVGPANDPGSWFGYEAGGSVVVGALTKSIKLVGDEVQLTYLYSGGDFPTIMRMSDLPLFPGEEDEGVAWHDNEDGTATATTAKGDGSRHFFYAVTTKAFTSKTVSAMPFEARGGIFGPTNQLPVKLDSIITVESGGKAYKVLGEAQ